MYRHERSVILALVILVNICIQRDLFEKALYGRLFHVFLIVHHSRPQLGDVFQSGQPLVAVLAQHLTVARALEHFGQQL